MEGQKYKLNASISVYKFILNYGWNMGRGELPEMWHPFQWYQPNAIKTPESITFISLFANNYLSYVTKEKDVSEFQAKQPIRCIS